MSKDKIEGFMLKLALSYSELGDGAWVITDGEKGLENVVVAGADSLVVIRVKVMEIPEQRQKEFFEKLLRLNASELVHGAYALDGNDVVLVDTLEAETLDLEEFQASLDAISLALAQHYRVLSEYRKKKTEEA